MKGSPGVKVGGGEGKDSQMSPPFLRTVVAKGLLWAGELSWAFSFLGEFASKTATRHESICSQDWDCLGTGLLLCRLNHQGAVFSSHLLDLLLAFDRADHFLLEALSVFAAIVPDLPRESPAFLLASSLSALPAHPLLPTSVHGTSDDPDLGPLFLDTSLVGIL